MIKVTIEFENVQDDKAERAACLIAKRLFGLGVVFDCIGVSTKHREMTFPASAEIMLALDAVDSPIRVRKFLGATEDETLCCRVHAMPVADGVTHE